MANASIFDKFVAAVERLEPSVRRDGLIKMLNKVHLFRFDKAPHEFLPKTWSAEKQQFANENLFLPFQFTAIEDAASLVLIADEAKHQRGASKPRIVMDVIPSNAPLSKFTMTGGKLRPADSAGYSAEAIKLFDFVVSVGNVSSVEFRNNGTWVQPSSDVEVWTIKGSRLKPLPNVDESVRNSFLVNAVAAFEEVEFFNNPEFFVIEEVQEKARDKYQKHARKRGKIARSHQRPVYTVLKPKKIRDKLHLPAPSAVGGVRLPHERRAHLRMYRHDKFVNMKGKTLIVKACWIGPSEVTVKSRRYRVLLNLMPPTDE